MGILDILKGHSDTVNSGDHQAKLSHEAIAGAAAFEAMKAFQKHQEANGKPQSHELAKEMLAGFAAAEADKLFETKGLDYIDREKAKRDAVQNTVTAYDEQYGNQL